MRTDVKTHLRMLKLVDKIFHLVPSCSQISSVANEDHLQPGQSFLFASLELLVCVLLSYYPSVAGDLQLGPIFQMKLAGKSNGDHQQQMNDLILSNMKLLSELITLCTSDEGTSIVCRGEEWTATRTILGLQALVPVVLHLLLSTSSVLLTTKSTEHQQLLATITQFLENIFSTPIDKNILYCTIVTIINLRNKRRSPLDHRSMRGSSGSSDQQGHLRPWTLRSMSHLFADQFPVDRTDRSVSGLLPSGIQSPGNRGNYPLDLRRGRSMAFFLDASASPSMSEPTVSMCKYLDPSSMYPCSDTLGAERTENTEGESSPVYHRDSEDFRNTAGGGRFNLAYVRQSCLSIDF